MLRSYLATLSCGLLFLLQVRAGPAAPVVRIATYNLDSYLNAPTASRLAKSPESKAKIRDTLHRLGADILALQEVGSSQDLEELRLSLKAEGLDYPYSELVRGFDTNICLAVLSRVRMAARRPHVGDSFLLYGRRFQVSRGFAEVDLEVNPRYRLTLITAHLKSRRTVTYGDEADLREQEALVLRDKINTLLSARPQANLVVLGDFNDTKDSRTVRILLGQGTAALLDTRPPELNGDGQISPNPRSAPRNITWTHYYGKEDTYSRIDYILISRSLAREWLPAQTQVLALPNWGVASDHRPIVAAFIAQDQ